eukprot:TRINITY_DN5133_c0_g1_i3.p1 TRINITY_DN5133_c0_g1~~TRINITY_DN5133_c0_g1_i3.p1  ORF type:complete len:347 (-),score=57.72 TRINITY_DN5133_c0_g1_i3:130-1170(-)
MEGQPPGEGEAVVQMSRWPGQGGHGPPSGGSSVTVSSGSHSGLIGTLAVLTMLASFVGIIQYTRKAKGSHLVQTWSFYFDWIFACLVGVTWAELLVVVAPNDYTTLWVTGVYCGVGTVVYPALSILFSARFAHNFDKVTETSSPKLQEGEHPNPEPGSKATNARFRAGLDILLSASFAMADSVSHSLLFSVWAVNYLEYDAPAPDTQMIFFWLGIAVSVTVTVTISRILCRKAAAVLAAHNALQFQHPKREDASATSCGRAYCAQLGITQYLEQFCVVTAASFNTTLGWGWNYFYGKASSVVIWSDSSDFWLYYGSRTAVGLVLFPLLHLLVPSVDQDNNLSLIHI